MILLRLTPAVRSGVHLALGCILLGCSVFLVSLHVRTIREAGEIALPLASALPPLERRAMLLTSQIELSELATEQRDSSLQEQLRAHVLPADPDLARLLGFTDVIREQLRTEKMLKDLSDIDVGEKQEASLGTAIPATTQSISFSAVVTDEGLSRLLTLLGTAGAITVGDLFSPAQIDTLLLLVEAQDGSGILEVERFLSTDLRTYLSDPKSVEDRFLASFPSEQFLARFRQLLRESRLSHLRQAVEGDLHEALVRSPLWPVQFLQIDEVSAEQVGGGWQKVNVKMRAVGRR